MKFKETRKILSKMLVINVSISLLFIIYAISFFNYFNLNEFITTFVLGIVIVLLIFNIVTTYICLLTINTFVGPVYSINRLLKKYEDFNEKEFKLRDNDEFKEIENYARRIESLLSKAKKR
ncbi:hypothetical protein ABMA77_11135 [Halobacteriovorax sp. RZ-1]|uniref:hypothetical protein n=1 Tax=unclassified Halobacteriovorax TaxID=2639665 RepID=UPI0037248107